MNNGQLLRSRRQRSCDLNFKLHNCLLTIAYVSTVIKEQFMEVICVVMSHRQSFSLIHESIQRVTKSCFNFIYFLMCPLHSFNQLIWFSLLHHQLVSTMHRANIFHLLWISRESLSSLALYVYKLLISIILADTGRRTRFICNANYKCARKRLKFWHRGISLFTRK